MRKIGAVVLCCVVYSLGWSDDDSVIRALNLSGNAEVRIKESGVDDLFLEVGDALEAMNQGTVSISDLRDKLQYAYGDATYAADIAGMDDDAVIELSKNVIDLCMICLAFSRESTIRMSFFIIGETSETILPE